MTKVFVASLPMRWDAATKREVPSLDLNPAMEFGELVIITEGRKDGEAMGDAIELMEKRAQEFKNGDYVLMIGDPILNALFVAEIALRLHYDDDLHTPLDINCLRWVRKEHRYETIKI